MTVPPTTDAYADLATERVRLAAATALANAKCIYPELFGPRIVKSLAIGADGVVVVNDDDGAPRHGVTLRMLVAEVAAELPEFFR
jgi:hypothetical protein